MLPPAATVIEPPALLVMPPTVAVNCPPLATVMTLVEEQVQPVLEGLFVAEPAQEHVTDSERLATEEAVVVLVEIQAFS